MRLWGKGSITVNFMTILHVYAPGTGKKWSKFDQLKKKYSEFSQICKKNWKYDYVDHKAKL